MAHNPFRSIIHTGLVVPNQYQTDHEAPKRRDDGDVTDDLSQGASIVSGANTRYGQECHVSSQQHSALSKSDTSITLKCKNRGVLTYRTDCAQSDCALAMNCSHLGAEVRKSV